MVYKKNRKMKECFIVGDKKYIVSDETIKVGDWYLTFAFGSFSNNVIGAPRKCEDDSYNFTNCRKIMTDKEVRLLKLKELDKG